MAIDPAIPIGTHEAETTTDNQVNTANDPAIPVGTNAQQHQVITAGDLLAHWQGHRRLTRRVIEAFPEEHLFTYSLGGMRPFGDFIMEFLGMCVPGVEGSISGKWNTLEQMNSKDNMPTTKKELLKRWDEATEKLDELWPQIPPHRFQENDRAFGQWDGPIHYFIFYWIDNEIHHRGQAYVYLRSLGIEPPFFWER